MKDANTGAKLNHAGNHQADGGFEQVDLKPWAAGKNLDADAYPELKYNIDIPAGGGMSQEEAMF